MRKLLLVQKYLPLLIVAQTENRLALHNWQFRL